MFSAYWAVKGGAGTSVLAAAHALAAARSHHTVLVDLDGDLGAVLGVDLDGGAAGVSDWLRAGHEVPADGLERLLVPVTHRLWLLPRGAGTLDAERASVLGRILAASPRRVVLDAGTRPGPAGVAVAGHADRSVLVTRACYLALRRVPQAPLVPSEVALVREPSRVLGADEVATAVGAPVRTTLTVDPSVARAVDAGLLAGRVPRGLRRAFRPGGGR